MTSVLDLSDVGSAPLESVGGKARNLGRLIETGFPVPSGVVVPADMDVSDAVTVLSRLFVGERLAVRSSGRAEDGRVQSLAGRYESVLDVGTEDVGAAIDRVRRSASGAERMAVVVQRLVEPVCAGVAFSADPVTGERDVCIVTATSGLAERLVAGMVAGDEWRVNGRRSTAVRTHENVLDRMLARRVAAVTRRIEVAFGVPQDIEWAWDGDELWVVQARPMTGLPEHVSWDPPSDGVFSRSFRFGEWLPEPVTPLFESWALTRMERAMHGWMTGQVGQVAPEPHHVVVNGWYFYSMNWMPAPGVALWSTLRRVFPFVIRDWRRVSAMLPETAHHGYRILEDEWRADLLPRYVAQSKRAMSEVETSGPGRLVELVDELTDLAGLYFASIAVVAGSGYKLEYQLARFWNRHLRDELGCSHLLVLRGLPRRTPVADAPTLESLDWWKDTGGSGTPPPDLATIIEQREETEARARHALAGSPRRLAKFDRILADAQHIGPVREEQVSMLSLPWPAMRRAIERLGRLLVESGSIEAIDDVFFLQRSELTAALDQPVSMVDVVAERRRSRRRASALSAPLTIGRMPRVVRYLFGHTNEIMGAVRSPNAIVSGVPASPGRATGKVRVVLDSSGFEAFEPGEVLVAPLTAPAWTELFDRAAAVVTDVGSALAHASIIAREHGIPAVVGCGDATRRLQTGQTVTVDGARGNVEVAMLHDVDQRDRLR
jgi:phosphohistidine swiveling domain-containing protein